MGGRFTQAEADDRGILAALDLTTNKLAWRQQWREICYSGSVVTAGGLLFVGRNDGRLTALDKSNGRSLWEFMTDAGVNTTVTTFERNGDQRVVVHAGGGVFAGATRGDGIWMFSLNGTMKSLPVAAARAAAEAAASAVGRPHPHPRAPSTSSTASSSTPRPASRATASKATAATAAGRRSSAGCRSRRSSRCRKRAATRCRPSAAPIREADLRDVAAYIVEVLAK